MNATILDVAYHLPSTVLTNDMLEKAQPEWDMAQVFERTGVRVRHLASDGETSLDLAVRACDSLFERQPREDVDAILFCTQTPDYVMPPNACVLHGYLGLPESVIAFDFSLACSGFVYGLGIAQGYIRSGIARKVLLVNADTYSHLINEGDRSSRTLFSDAASATLIGTGDDSEGLLDATFATGGKKHGSFIVPAGGHRSPKSASTCVASFDKSGNARSDENIHMDGMGIFTFVNSKVPTQIKSLLSRNDFTVEDIDWFIFHQASKVALDSLTRLLRLPDEKVLRTLEETGNTVSASIPIVLKKGLDAGTIRTGDTVLMSGFGVGLSWASAIVRI